MTKGKSYYVGAANIRRLIDDMNEDRAVSFLLMLWPDMPKDVAEKVHRFPRETRVNGTQFTVPASWQVAPPKDGKKS